MRFWPQQAMGSEEQLASVSNNMKALRPAPKSPTAHNPKCSSHPSKQKKSAASNMTVENMLDLQPAPLATLTFLPLDSCVACFGPGNHCVRGDARHTWSPVNWGPPVEHICGNVPFNYLQLGSAKGWGAR
ncbi:unnamed protein product [Effrenium voratum]|nr:unnamed protein product [Effrenium voratum]